MTFVDLHVDQSAASSKNPEALDLNPKSHGMCSFICRKPWSSQSKHINLMAFVASYAKNMELSSKRMIRGMNLIAFVAS